MRKTAFFISIFAFGLIGCVYNSKFAESEIENAIHEVLTSEKINEITSDVSSYRISKELISFYEIGFLFNDELPDEVFEKADFGDPRNYETTIDNSLNRFSSRKRSNLYLFFSQKEKGFFIVEAFYSGQKLLRRADIPDTGRSVAFLLEERNNRILLIASQVVTYG